MRQGNMVGKFKVDIGTVYDNFGTFPNLFTFGPGPKKWITFSSFVRGIPLISFLVMEHLFSFAGLETSIAGGMMLVEMCAFAIWGLLCEFWQLFRLCNVSF